jgi:NADH:ubiquinone oxidoreductase subunit 3 (subunit A)
MLEYQSILIYLILSIVIAVVIITASNLLINKTPDAQKVSIYECGFDPIGDSRQKFEVRFFLVAILFIISDLEISFLFP